LSHLKDWGCRMALTLLVLGASVLTFLVYLLYATVKNKLNLDSTGNFILGIISFWSGFLLLIVLLIVVLTKIINNFPVILSQDEQNFLGDYGLPLLVGGAITTVSGLVKIREALSEQINLK
jgi:hypothetical protein